MPTTTTNLQTRFRREPRYVYLFERKTRLFEMRPGSKTDRLTMLVADDRPDGTGTAEQTRLRHL